MRLLRTQPTASLPCSRQSNELRSRKAAENHAHKYQDDQPRARVTMMCSHPGPRALYCYRSQPLATRYLHRFVQLGATLALSRGLAHRYVRGLTTPSIQRTSNWCRASVIRIKPQFEHSDRNQDGRRNRSAIRVLHACALRSRAPLSWRSTGRCSVTTTPLPIQAGSYLAGS